jgi:hypothetical protein
VLPKLAVTWWSWSALGPHGIGNRWSSAVTSGHDGYEEPQVVVSSRPAPRLLKHGGRVFESLIPQAVAGLRLLPTRQVVVIDGSHPPVQLAAMTAMREPASFSAAVPSACP